YWATRTLLKPKRCYMTSMISCVTTRHRLNGSVYHPQFMKVPHSGASDGETSGYVRADATHHFCWADDCGSMREHECCGASCMPKRAKESPTPSMTGIDSRKIKELRRLLKAKTTEDAVRIAIEEVLQTHRTVRSLNRFLDTLAREQSPAQP